MADRRKRTRHGNRAERHPDSQKEREDSINVDESSPVIQMFRGFQRELDDKHDRHERIVKLSRDITIESKRIIFTLHRVKDASSSEELLKQTEDRLLDLERSKFKQVARELVDQEPYKYLRAYTAGLQEYIEALTFYVFLKENRLLPLQGVQDRLVFKVQPQEETTNKLEQKCDVPDKKAEQSSDTEMTASIEKMDVTNEQSEHKDGNTGEGNEETIRVLVPASEYVLGIADLTGEMMRRAINSVGDGDLERPFEICKFLQAMELAFSALTNCNREVGRKLTVLRQSLRKVEAACYTLKVRGSEIPEHMLVDVISKSNVSQYVEDPGLIEDD